MAIDQKEAQAKEFLNRGDIVTMKKDIKRLREADAFKESARITTTPIAKQPPKGASKEEIKIPVSSEPRVEPKKDFTKKIVISPTPKDAQKPTRPSGNKNNATEDEKQKIFLLESQRTETEKELRLLSEKTPALESEKSNIQKEREGWQNKLSVIIEEGKTGTEEQKQEVEKKRWPIETELEKTGNRIKDVDAKYNELGQTKTQLVQKITQIDNSLKEIYSNIETRTQAAETVSRQPITPPTPPKKEMPPAESPVKEPEKPYLKNIPPAVKEKLAESVSSEEEQRRKFLEDIDKWASFHNNQEKK